MSKCGIIDIPLLSNGKQSVPVSYTGWFRRRYSAEYFFSICGAGTIKCCNCLRKPMCAARRDIFETVDNEKSDCGIWKYCSKILYKFWRIFPFGKNHKRDKTGCHRSKNNSSNSNDRLCCCPLSFRLPPPVFYCIYVLL